MVEKGDVYDQVMEVLQKRFGNKCKIGFAFSTKLYDWPLIKSCDTEGLEECTDDLTQCLEIKAAIPRISKPVDCEELLQLA